MRIVGWYILLLSLTLLALLLVSRHLLLLALEERISSDLAQEVEELRTLAGGLDPSDGQPFGDRIDRLFEVFLQRNLPAAHETMVAFVGGQPFLRSVGEPALRLERQPELVARWNSLSEPERGSVQTAEVGAVDYLAVPVRLDGEVRGVFVVAAFTDLARQEVDDVVRVTAFVGAGALVLGMALAWSVSSRVLAPVRDLTRTARTISDTDLDRRIEVIGDDEIGHLATTFNAMLDRLEAAFTTQRHFIDDAGHELRTPLTIVRGHLELLEDDPVERAQTIELVLDELDRMNRMVEELLLLAKAQQPDFLDVSAVEMSVLTREVQAKAQAIAPRQWRLEACASGWIVADRQRLTQALVQLAQNATQHTTADDVVAIGSALERGVARFWVRDEGAGITPEDQRRIFDRFARGAAPRRSDGAGLGLSIVKAIAEAHRGSLELRSRPGEGACFTLLVPADAPHDGRTGA